MELQYDLPNPNTIPYLYRCNGVPIFLAEIIPGS